MKIKTTLLPLLMPVLLASAFLCHSCRHPLSYFQIYKLSNLLSSHFPADGPAAAIAILQGDSILFRQVYGIADMPSSSPTTTETLFCLASVSKQFTATAILQLCEQGLMSLNDPVRQYFPEFAHPIWDHVQVWHLLAHSSGIPDARGHYPRAYKLAAGDEEALAYLDTLTWNRFQPGSYYEYINPTFVLAGKIIEKVSGQEFGTYMREHIFSPAGMHMSRYLDAHHPEALYQDAPLVAHGYEWDDDAWQEYDFGEETFFATRPDGALYTSVDEFILWEKALRNGLLLSPETIRQAWTPHTIVTDSPYESYNVRPNTTYGLGWFIEPATDSTHTVIYHTGENGGFHNIAARYPDSNTLIVILSARPDWNQYELLQTIENLLDL